MSDRVSKAVLLCEDQEHERLVFAFLKRCGIRSPGRLVLPRIASELRSGGNVGWVLEEFPKELRAFRNRQSKAKSLLIVVVDADNQSVTDRRNQLNDRAQQADLESAKASESVAILVPKRHVETWIRFLLGEYVTEVDDCKANQQLSKDQFRQAADRLYELSRANAVVEPDCLSSLVESLPVWRMIGDCLK